MRRTERLFQLVQMLRRAGGPAPGRALAAELGVSLRSLYRDVAMLQSEGVPVRGEAGVGYVLEPGFDMPPLMLTGDELDADVLGAQWVISRGEPELARAASDLLVKLRHVIPERLSPHVLEPTVSVAPTVQDKDLVDAAVIRQALRERRKVEIAYRDGREQETRRVVWPVLLGYRDQGRILAASRAGEERFRRLAVVSAPTYQNGWGGFPHPAPTRKPPPTGHPPRDAAHKPQPRQPQCSPEQRAPS